MMMMMTVAVCRHPVILVCGVSVGWCKVVTSLTDTEHESLPRVIPDLSRSLMSSFNAGISSSFDSQDKYSRTALTS